MVVAFRLTLPEYRRLQALSMRRGLGVGELARVLVLGGLDGQTKSSALADGASAVEDA